MIVNLFSKRQKKLRGEVPDVFQYDELPQPLRVQIIHILKDTLGYDNLRYSDNISKAYQNIFDVLIKEYGLFYLVKIHHNGYRPKNDVLDFLIVETNIERVLDAIEVSFRCVDTVTRNYSYCGLSNASKIATAAIDELNARFREHGVGYSFSDGEIIRIDSQLIHAEVVKPALGLLREKEFSGAQQEFLTAHEHHRHKRNKEAINECLKAFESTMKAICDKRGWAYDKGKATSKELINICFTKDLIPQFWQSEFSSLRGVLESGVPTGRNKLAGHGQGAIPTDVPEHIVAYILHQTAAAIVFLVEAERALK
ncbi:MAG: hypothetical protein WCF85_04420 [Rhodospirillaceae bacterium]